MAVVEVSVERMIAVITLNRPEALNALNADVRAALVTAWNGAHEDPGVRVIVLTGAGDRAFCAGADLKDARLDEADYLADEAFGTPPRKHFMRAMRNEKPVVCAINGHALGGGLELALACDIRIASENATFGLPEVRVGSMPGAGGTQYLPRAISMSDAMYLILTGARVTAEQAIAMRLISECLPLPRLLPRALEIAEQIASNAPLAVRAAKRAVMAAYDMPLQHGIDYERDLWGLVRSTEDRREGRAAFREGRPPRYTGR